MRNWIEGFNVNLRVKQRKNILITFSVEKSNPRFVKIFLMITLYLLVLLARFIN